MKITLFTLTIASSCSYGCDIDSSENFTDLDEAKKKMNEEFNHACKRFKDEIELDVDSIGKDLGETDFRVYDTDDTSLMTSGEIIENTIEISL